MDFKALSHATVNKLSAHTEGNEYIRTTVRESVEVFASELFRILNNRSSSLQPENEQVRNSAEVARIKSERDAVVARLTDEVARYALELQKKKDEYDAAMAQINAEFVKVVEEANKYIKSNNALIETNQNMMTQLAHLKSVTPLAYEERMNLAQFRTEAELWKSLAEKKDVEIKTLTQKMFEETEKYKRTILTLKHENYMLKQLS